MKVLAYYQILGGLIGIGAVGYALMMHPITGRLLLVFVLAFALYVFSGWCGWMLLKNTSKGLFFSLINQVLQVIVFVLGSYAFEYVAGVSLLVALNLAEEYKLSFNLNLSSFQFNFNAQTEGILIGVNVVAFYLVYFISLARDKVKERELLLGDAGKYDV